MKRISTFLAVVTVLAFWSCKNNAKQENEEMQETVEEVQEVVTSEPKSVSVTMASKSGSNATGQVYFSEMDGTVTMEAKFSGLEPGNHAIHLHETADCSADDATSSGGHWNPTFEPHGAWGSENGYHKGDIGNFSADENGNGSLTFSTDEWCIGCGDEKKDILGKAVIVHQGSDDLTSQPSGNAGARVSCGGVIE